MWLLNTATLALVPKSPEDCSYAILSHTWEPGEVTFQEIADLELARQKPGFSKIERTCQLAHERGINYAWVDTCCIDKTSSAELTEAINSMFRWYKESTVCFVFLCDLPALGGDISMMDDYFPRCRWFRRGWTLQELIASSDIDFYDQEWNYIGNKVSLQRRISKITGIDPEILENSDALSTVSIARRMSWAATRITLRLEDRAYSLFGIFDVQLPLIYGEGYKAFIRLQEAIAQDNNDLSLLAWTSTRNDQEFRGVFARSPDEFEKCGSVQRIIDPAVIRTEFSMTNKGFHITATLNIGEQDLLLNLQCVDTSIQQAEGADGIIAIRIVRVAHGYVRHRSHRRVIVSRSNLQIGDPVDVYIPKDVIFAESLSIKTRLAHRFVFEIVNESSFSCSVTEWPSHLWDQRSNSFLTDGYENFTGLIKITVTGSKVRPGRRDTQPTHTSSSADPLRRFDSTENSTQTLHHSSTYAIVFGLETSESTWVSGVVPDWKPIKPWAALYGPTDQMVVAIFPSQECLLGFPYGLSQIRELVRGVPSSHVLPKSLRVSLPWDRHSTALAGWFAGFAKDNTRSTSKTVRKSQIRLSLSVEILENSPTGMFRLALRIKTRD